MKRLHANLKKSEQNSIERIRLVRMIKPFDLKNKSNGYKKVDKGIIYEAYMDGLSMLVSHAEIGDIIEDKQWLTGELKCLSNMASNQIVKLSWGAKKKELLQEFLTTHALPVGEDLHVGSNVVVLNHGKHWQH